jgi:hypothetical protein
VVAEKFYYLTTHTLLCAIVLHRHARAALTHSRRRDAIDVLRGEVVRLRRQELGVHVEQLEDSIMFIIAPSTAVERRIQSWTGTPHYLRPISLHVEPG